MLRGKNITVNLAKHEVISGAMLGVYRRVESQFDNRTTHVKNHRWDIDISGALGEQALAKGMGVYFDPTLNTFKAADLGDVIQVRTTDYRSGRLILRKEDNPEHIYVLVINDMPRFRIVGWMQGRDMKQKKYVDNPKGQNLNPAFFVPQNDLNPFPFPIEVVQSLGRK